MPEKSDYEKPISGNRLREALREASAVLGRAAQDAMFNDLEMNGVAFKDKPYTLLEMQEALRKVFGYDGTGLLMKRLEKVLEME